MAPRLLLPWLASWSLLVLPGCVAEAPQPLTGGDVQRQVAADGRTSIAGRSTGDVCGPPPVDLGQRTTVDLDAKVLDYVKAGGKVEALSGIKQVLAGADLGCDAVMYRSCKVCFATQNGQGCAALTLNALAYCQERTGAPHTAAPAGVGPISLGTPPSPMPPAPPTSTADPTPILRFVVSLWTDSDDKDRDESVSVRVLWGQDIVGSGGPWGRGEVWGDQENRNNGLAHEFTVPLTRPVLLGDVSALRLEISKSQSGGNGGKGWSFKPGVIAETPRGRTEVWRSAMTIRLGAGHAATFATGL
jgi:hypothetical protein